jgi:Type II CAAX prenyl endopeptidase Rce1-like
MTFSLAYPLLLMAGWIFAWVVHSQAQALFAWGGAADAIYWIIAKLAVWVLPTAVFVKRRQKGALADYFSLRQPGRGLAYGAPIGLAVLAASFLLEFILGGASFNIPVLDLTLVSSLLVTPFAEEWALRGFYMRGLTERGVALPDANSYAAYAFVAMYFPGWYFQGRLREPLGVLQQVIFLWLFGLVLGWSKNAWPERRRASLYTPMVVHALNNLYVAAR